MTDADDGTDAWYRSSPGVAAVAGYVALAAVVALGSAAGVSVAAALRGPGLPAVDVPRLAVVLPLDVYRFALLGALTRFVLAFGAPIPSLRDAPSPPDDQSESDRFAKHVVSVFAAPPLAAGVFLAVTATTGSPASGGTVTAAVAFVVGMFTRGAHRALGNVADRLLDPVEETEVSTVSLAGRARLATLVLAVLGLVLVAWSAVGSGTVTRVCPGTCAPVPADVYAYALLGGVGYVFTALLNAPDKPPSWLARASLRVLAGATLAAGIYVVVSPAGHLVALLSYLTGLYTNAAVARLAAFGSALFTRLERSETPDGNTRD